MHKSGVAFPIVVIVVEGLQYSDQVNRHGHDHQDVEDLMRRPDYVEFPRTSTLGELELLNKNSQSVGRSSNLHHAYGEPGV